MLETVIAISMLFFIMFMISRRSMSSETAVGFWFLNIILAIGISIITNSIGWGLIALTVPALSLFMIGILIDSFVKCIIFRREK